MSYGSNFPGLALPKIRARMLDKRERAAAAAKTLREVRTAVFKREHGICRICRINRALHLHHVVYRSKGGSTATWACIATCKNCHAEIHAKLIRVVTFTDADLLNGITFERL